MPSPFPGMDPYIEDPARWSDFHTTMNTAMRAALTRTLPRPYVARLERHIWIHQSGSDEGILLRGPDVYVVAPNGHQPPTSSRTALAAPSTLTLPVKRKRGATFIKIVDALNQRVVTVVELLSHANKTGDTRRAYLAKRNELRSSGVNLVEIDLLRGGKRLPLGKPRPQRSHYLILVGRADEMPVMGCWKISVRDPLPILPIPLDPSVEDVPLDLRACLDRAYEEANFAWEIDYSKPPRPPLREPDAAWARELLARRQGGA
jgi:hypothetical protein